MAKSAFTIIYTCILTNRQRIVIYYKLNKAILP
nr:MAG TPA: hypothetical protein [Caudoviricetes sp.]